MEERNLSPVSSSGKSASRFRSSSRKGKKSRRQEDHWRSRHEEDEDGGGGGDQITCTGKSCKSCTAGVIADCVAVCCCPCAVVNLFILAFFKVPYMVGRRCLGLGKKKRRKLENQMKCQRSYSDCVRDMDGISMNGKGEEGTSGIVSPGEGQIDSFSASFEAEEVWLELYKIGQLGFGRVSFTGIPSQSKGD